jgi:putative pyruvate formate lyase activating enzyme
MKPAYLKNEHIIEERIEKSRAVLESCEICPRRCKVNRLKGEKGICRTGSQALVSSFSPHFGEEDPLVGTEGSGTIFFTNCNLLCAFCQNYDISHAGNGYEVNAVTLAGMMIELQGRGVHNINFVTPSHVVPQILEALPYAIDKGVRVPLVYNSSAYDSVKTLKLLDGIIDIYMPDLKFSDSDVSRAYCKAPDYPAVAQEAIKEMHRQVGDLILNDQNIAVRGLLVRHLVMPENKAGTKALMKFLAREISKNTYVNIMAQYRPCGDAQKFKEINRPITSKEHQSAVNDALSEGITRLDERRPHFFFRF